METKFKEYILSTLITIVFCVIAYNIGGTLLPSPPKSIGWIWIAIVQTLIGGGIILMAVTIVKTVREYIFR